jgi:hypothetical protein
MRSDMKRLIGFLSIVLVLAAAGGAFYYWHRVTSPEHSLKQLATALQQRDLTTFEKYVDTDTLVRRLAEDQILVTSAMNAQTSPDSEPLDPEKVRERMPGVVEEMKRELAYHVEHGEFNSKSSSPAVLALQGAYESVAGKDSEYSGLERPVMMGKTAEARLVFKHKEFSSPLLLPVRMRKRDGYWQVTEVGFTDYMKQLFKQVNQKVEQHNRPLLAAFQRDFALENVTRDREEGYGGKYVILTALVRNDGAKAVKSFQARFMSKDGHRLLDRTTGYADIQDEMPPGGTATVIARVWVHGTATEKLYNDLDYDWITVTPEVWAVTFTDGTSLELENPAPKL